MITPEAQAAASLLNEMKILVQWDTSQNKWRVNMFQYWWFTDYELIQLCKDKLFEYDTVNTYPRCPDCNHKVDEYDVDNNGICSCGFCYYINFEEVFNQGNVIPKT